MLERRVKSGTGVNDCDCLDLWTHRAFRISLDAHIASRRVVSFQVTVLKVLAGHPGGCLPVDELKRAVAILICSGPDWTKRTKRLLARAPNLDIFGQSLVICDAHRWQITEPGRVLLATIESSASAAIREEEATQDTVSEQPDYSTSAPLPHPVVGRRRRVRRRRNSAAARRTVA